MKDLISNLVLKTALSALSLTAFLTISCGTPPPPPDPGSQRDDDYYDDLNERNKEERDKTLDKARKRYTGPKCETDDDCKKVCRSLYRSTVREDCLSLTIANVEVLEDIHNMFKNPKEKDLDELDADDFDTYVSIDVKPFDKRVNAFSATEAKRVLAWLTEDDKARDHFRGADDEFDLFEDMLKKISGSGNNLVNALRRSVSGANSLADIATKEGNEGVLAWLHEFFEGSTGTAKCGDKTDQEVCVLKEWYCNLGLNKEEWDDVAAFEPYETLVGEILSDYTTKTGSSSADNESTRKTKVSWWTNDIEEIGDLNNNSDVRDLCPDAIKLIRRP